MEPGPDTGGLSRQPLLPEDGARANPRARGKPCPRAPGAHHGRIVLLQGRRLDRLAEEPPVPERVLLPLETLIQ